MMAITSLKSHPRLFPAQFYRNIFAQRNALFSTKQGSKIIVFGGNGYVGQHICEVATTLYDCEVVSISRSGKPKSPVKASWMEKVTWAKGDIFEGSTYEKHFEGAAGAVSCVGAFGSNEFMEKMNGDANINAAREAKKAGVKHFVFVSTVDSNLPHFVLQGYFNGKRRAEKEVLNSFPETGVVLRPSFVYGTRYQGSFGIPLWILGQPLEKVFSLSPVSTLADNIPGMKAILAPPISVEVVAKNAAAAATGMLNPGIHSVKDMVSFSTH